MKNKQELINECKTLSRGTIASLTGLRKCDEIDKWQNEFVEFVDVNYNSKWESWMDAYDIYKVTAPMSEWCNYVKCKKCTVKPKEVIDGINIYEMDNCVPVKFNLDLTKMEKMDSKDKAITYAKENGKENVFMNDENNRFYAMDILVYYV